MHRLNDSSIFQIWKILFDGNWHIHFRGKCSNSIPSVSGHFRSLSAFVSGKSIRARTMLLNIATARNHNIQIKSFVHQLFSWIPACRHISRYMHSYLLVCRAHCFRWHILLGQNYFHGANGNERKKEMTNYFYRNACSCSAQFSVFELWPNGYGIDCAIFRSRNSKRRPFCVDLRATFDLATSIWTQLRARLAAAHGVTVSAFHSNVRHRPSASEYRK